VVELDVAQLRMGLKLDPDKVMEKMQGAVVPVGDGGKWYLPDFVAFQYGKLNSANRVHASVLERLSSLGIDPENKPLTSPLQGAKDKDKDKDTQERKERESEKPPFDSPAFLAAWSGFVDMRTKKRAPITDRARSMLFAKLRSWGEAKAIQALDKSTVSSWTDVFEPKTETPPPEKTGQRRDLKTTWD
jgi:hypothetical protein